MLKAYLIIQLRDGTDPRSNHPVRLSSKSFLPDVTLRLRLRYECRLLFHFVKPMAQGRIAFNGHAQSGMEID